MFGLFCQSVVMFIYSSIFPSLAARSFMTTHFYFTCASFVISMLFLNFFSCCASSFFVSLFIRLPLRLCPFTYYFQSVYLSTSVFSYQRSSYASKPICVRLAGLCDDVIIAKKLVFVFQAYRSSSRVVDMHS